MLFLSRSFGAILSSFDMGVGWPIIEVSMDFLLMGPTSHESDLGGHWKHCVSRLLFGKNFGEVGTGTFEKRLKVLVERLIDTSNLALLVCLLL